MPSLGTTIPGVDIAFFILFSSKFRNKCHRNASSNKGNYGALSSFSPKVCFIYVGYILELTQNVNNAAQLKNKYQGSISIFFDLAF